ncbi:MAG: hypothetical protein WDZ59_00630 [Pirellulales bacterium]
MNIIYRVYRKAARTLSRGDKLPRVFFLHVPKCGGVSVKQALRQKYVSRGQMAVRLDPQASSQAADLCGEEMLEFRRRLLLYELHKNANRLVTGHYPYPLPPGEIPGEAWSFVTVLRDPVARWYSHYFYGLGIKNRDHFPIDVSLREFIDSDWRAKAHGALMVKMLVPDTKCVDTAIERLNHFAVVGILEDLARFTADCRNQLGLSLRIPHVNASPTPIHERHKEITPEIHQQVVELCEPDRRVYQAALKRLENKERLP